MIARIALCLLVCTFYQAQAEVDLITEPRPGEEYVLVSSGQQQTPLRNFESSHKIPDKHPNHRILKPSDGVEKITKKIHVSSKLKHSSEGIISIEEDKKASFKKEHKSKVGESIEIDVPVSKIEDIKIEENVKNVDTNPKMAVALEAMSESGKLSNRASTTTQKPVLTTADPSTTKAYEYIPINFDTIDDINTGLLPSSVKLDIAGSEQKQHSRIQIKKGPNGQDYEYEYIYYYYDDEDEKNKTEGKTTTTTTAVPIHNSHDGPQKVESENQIAKENKPKSKYSTIDRSASTTTSTAAPEQNEIHVSTSRTRHRGRTIAPAPVEEHVQEDRLPSSTRFPPRGRNLAVSSSTTYVPEVSSEAIKHRGRAQVDNVADESIGQTRSRTRAHIRRPSSELVDLDSFKTHSGDIPSQYKELPSRYSSESKTTSEIPETSSAKDSSHAKEREGHSIIGAIRFQEILDDSKLPPDYYKKTTPYVEDTTEFTTMAAMEKVALDLYAYLAGENLNNDVTSIEFDGTTTVDDAFTTEALSTTEEATTPSTTTTTTAAPTTASTRPQRFKGRIGARGRSTTTAQPTDAPQEPSTKTRGRFSKPGTGRRTSTTATAESSTQAAVTAEKPAKQPTFGRRGLFPGRTRPSSTTAAPAEATSTSTAGDTSTQRSRLRPALKRVAKTSTTAAPTEDNTAASSNSADNVETTIAPARSIGHVRPGLKPSLASLRPGPRLNLRANPRRSQPAETEVPADTPAPDTVPIDTEADPSSATPAPAENNRLKPRTRMQVSPKPRAPVTSPPRRPNPLLKRGQATTEATTEAVKKSTEPSEEKSEESETVTEIAETTPAPPLRGLDALFARRRAAGGGAFRTRPVRHNRPN